MKNIYSVFRKEFLAWFQSPTGYVFLVFFVLVSNGSFFLLNHFFDAGQVSMRGWFGLLPWIFLFFVPAFSMAAWSEEKGSGTIELLLTLPVSERQAVLGKFFAGLAFLGVALACTLTVPFTLGQIGDADGGAIFAAYVGSLLLGASYYAVGMFLSGLSRNQVVAFIVSISILFVLLLVGHPDMVGLLASFFEDSVFFSGVVHFFSYLSLLTHFGNITRGVVDSRDVLYYLLVIATFLTLNVKYLEARKWK